MYFILYKWPELIFYCSGLLTLIVLPSASSDFKVSLRTPAETLIIVCSFMKCKACPSLPCEKSCRWMLLPFWDALLDLYVLPLDCPSPNERWDESKKYQIRQECAPESPLSHSLFDCACMLLPLFPKRLWRALVDFSSC